MGRTDAGRDLAHANLGRDANGIRGLSAVGPLEAELERRQDELLDEPVALRLRSLLVEYPGGERFHAVTEGNRSARLADRLRNLLIVAGDTGVLWGLPGLRLVICTAGKMAQRSVTADAREQVGALGKAKMVLREVVQLPLQQPALFAKGSLARPTKGILLFGPPGASRPPAFLACTAHMDSITLLCLTGTFTLRCPKSGV